MKNPDDFTRHLHPKLQELCRRYALARWYYTEGVKFFHASNMEKCTKELEDICVELRDFGT